MEPELLMRSPKSSLNGMMWLRVFALKAERSERSRLERQLGLSTHNPKHMTADDVSKLAAFAYHSHPDIFQDVLRAACTMKVPQ